MGELISVTIVLIVTLLACLVCLKTNFQPDEKTVLSVRFFAIAAFSILFFTGNFTGTFSDKRSISVITITFVIGFIFLGFSKNIGISYAIVGTILSTLSVLSISWESVKSLVSYKVILALLPIALINFGILYEIPKLI